MSGIVDLALNAALIGIGATAFMDLFVEVRSRVLGISALDYAMVGRWIGHMAKGRLSHESIAAAHPIPGERALGWTAHYLIGILFAAVLLAVWGPAWAERPSLIPALAVGVATVALPFFVMQPAMGMGVAASRTPNPGQARLRTLVTHLVFGLGLYLAGWLLQLVR